MFKSTITVIALLALALPASGAIIVRDWQFNTPGDNEGWNASTFLVSNLHVASAVSGSESVLTCDHLQNQADPRLTFPNQAIALPDGVASWESLVLRIRQIGADGVSPVAFDSAGTIAMYGAGSIPTIAPIPTATNAAGAPPVVVVAQADQWQLITWDLTAYAGTINANVRLDPMAGTLSGENVLGNFEIDYVTLTAVPEPATLGLLACGAMAVIRKRR